ncbi:hypothetical protein F2P81_014235 [Scophthalmus maximus]|uniref:Transmembrane protein TMEM132 cohesin-like domain-containing protein n=1 Tax=Scophthalmus maximus TaxID=52904 RepID=A0A6A4SNA7_SCOMX|nr:hypothetical protein F2P81_014235 [Scophthalmus maximus]
MKTRMKNKKTVLKEREDSKEGIRKTDGAGERRKREKRGEEGADEEKRETKHPDRITDEKGHLPHQQNQSELESAGESCKDALVFKADKHRQGFDKEASSRQWQIDSTDWNRWRHGSRGFDVEFTSDGAKTPSAEWDCEVSISLYALDFLDVLITQRSVLPFEFVAQSFLLSLLNATAMYFKLTRLLVLRIRLESPSYEVMQLDFEVDNVINLVPTQTLHWNVEYPAGAQATSRQSEKVSHLYISNADIQGIVPLAEVKASKIGCYYKLFGPPDLFTRTTGQVSVVRRGERSLR